MRQVHAGIAEADAGIRRGEQHLGARLVVGGVLDGAHEVAGHHPQRLQRPDVADGIRPLVGRAQAPDAPAAGAPRRAAR